MSFTEDLSAFFDTADFADAGLLDGLTTINGILDEEYTEAAPGDVVGINTRRPVFYFDLGDLAGIGGQPHNAVGLAFVLNSITYTVRDVEAEDNLAKMILELV